MKISKIAKKLIILPIVIVLFLSVMPFTQSQLDTSVISLSGTNWNLKVDSTLQTATDSKSTPYVSTTEKGEKELFLTLNSLEDCKLGYIQFKVQTQGLTVYKQLPLNEEVTISEEYDYINATHAMLNGVVKTYRPENVVNSFACFDDSGKKVLHIYASKLIDAGGQSIWVDSDLKDGLLTVFLDAKFLDSAKFPVILDPTFGYTSIGATEESTGIIIGSKFTLSEDATVTSFSAYSGANSSGGYYFGIYDSSFNQKYISSWIGATTSQWVTISDLSVELSAGTYWLCGDGASSWTYAYDSGDTNQGLWSSSTYASDPLVLGGYLDIKVSIYANYTEEAEPTPTPTATPEPTETATPTPTPTSTEFTSTETWNIIILLVMLIVGLILALKRTLPILNFVFGMFAIAISAWTLTVAPYFGGLLQLAVIIIGIIVMVSGYKEVY